MTDADDATVSSLPPMGATPAKPAADLLPATGEPTAVTNGSVGSAGGPPPSDGGTIVPRGKPAPRKRSTARTLLEWGGLIIAALLIAFVIKTYLVEAFYIPSESMTPTLLIGDRVLVNKLSYDLHDVHRGDIVVFKAPPGEETAQIKDLVKRVVGLPGETIEGRGGHIYIDNKQLAEPYLPKGVQSRVFPAEKIPPGHYYVLGDNRQNSKDSTYFHAINGNLIVGRVFLRIWPLNRIGTL
ncbi:MAG: signal peptidase [Actinomycetia bacterium]|nr:signal peptidase [Actinomycetes bacterium]